MSPFLAWGDFHACSRFARSTIPEEKWRTTRSLNFRVLDKTMSIQRIESSVIVLSFWLLTLVWFFSQDETVNRHDLVHFLSTSTINKKGNTIYVTQIIVVLTF